MKTIIINDCEIRERDGKFFLLALDYMVAKPKEGSKK